MPQRWVRARRTGGRKALAAGECTASALTGVGSPEGVGAGGSYRWSLPCASATPWICTILLFLMVAESRFQKQTPWPPRSATLACSPTAMKHLLCPRRSLPSRIPSPQQPGDHLPHHHYLQQAMDLFTDGGFVRLESGEVSGPSSSTPTRTGRGSPCANGAVPCGRAPNAASRVQH